MCTYIYVLNFPIFCAIWLKKCDFITQKLGIKKDPDPKLFIPDPDPSKSSGSFKKFRIHNTGDEVTWIDGTFNTFLAVHLLR